MENIIRFRYYSIRNGSSAGINASLQGMYYANLDLGVFQETKVVNGFHTQKLVGYRVLLADAPS